MWKEKIVGLLNAYSFLLVAGSLVFLESILILKGEWAGDFWEHSAVVKELSAHLIDPGNPIIKSSTPHAFFSPYSLLVAVFSRITGLNSIQALTWFAFFNLILFVYSFYKFCQSLFRKDYQLVAAISLLFILFFYGARPFQWSGFYHIRVLNYVLPYPSTFALSLSFLVMARVAKSDGSNPYGNIVLIIILTAIVFITHPTTAVFLYTGIICLNLFLVDHSLGKGILKSALFIVVSVVLGLTWPYYSMADLLLGKHDIFNDDSYLLYTGILQKHWPVALALPALFCIKDKVAQFFIAAIILMSLVLILGYITRIYGFSRLVSNTMMFAHFLMSYLVVVHLERRVAFSKVYLWLLTTSFLLSLSLNFHRYLYSFNIFRKKDTAYYDRYSFLVLEVAPGDLILSDEESNAILISYNGKVISSKRPLYWVPDIMERRADVASFFNSSTPDIQRSFILHKYHPDYLLIDHSGRIFDKPTVCWLRRMGKTVYYKNQLELIRLK